MPMPKKEKYFLAACGFALIAAVGAYTLRPIHPEPALLVSTSELKPSFNHPQYSPCDLVPEQELLGPLRAEGFADAIGLGKGVRPSVIQSLPDFDIAKEFENQDPMDRPHGQRHVTDGKLSFHFWNECGPSTVVVSDEHNKDIAHLLVRGHAHTTGVVAPRRGILAATCADPDINKVEDQQHESQVIVFDYRAKKELGVLHMPLTYFKSMAISRDEKWLYIGFGDGTIRRFDIDSAKPSPKKAGWFGSSK